MEIAGEASPSKPPDTEQQRRLVEHLEAMAKQRDNELSRPDLPQVKRKVLTSLADHWAGLCVFVDQPVVPLDNNAAERSLRGPVVGRKNYVGSGAVWSGRLAAMLFSLFQTLSLVGWNPRLWLSAYLEACASSGGKAPADAEHFLPWKASEEQKKAWAFESAEVAEVDSS